MTKLRKELERQEREKHKYLDLYHSQYTRISQKDYQDDKERIKKEKAYNKLLKRLDKVKREKTKDRLIHEFIIKYHHKEGG